MKIEKSKHAHNLTKLLKVCLFGLVMLLPFLAILPSTLYFAFNEHAENYTHETVNTTYEYETNEVNSVDDLVVGNIYNFEIDLTNLPTYTAFLQTSYFRMKNNLYTYIALGANDNFSVASGSAENNSFIINYQDVNTIIRIEDTHLYCNVVFTTLNQRITYENFSASDYLGEKSVEVVSSEQSPLKAFYSASNELWQQPMFNWVNTGLGGIAIANMLSVFGIGQNTFISNILIYWLSITAIYIIIDIVIELFVALTHLIGKKAD